MKKKIFLHSLFMSLEKCVGVLTTCFDPKFCLKTKMHFFFWSETLCILHFVKVKQRCHCLRFVIVKLHVKHTILYQTQYAFQRHTEFTNIAIYIDKNMCKKCKINYSLSYFGKEYFIKILYLVLAVCWVEP